MNECLNIVSNVKIEIFDASDMKKLDEWYQRNKVVNVGLQQLANVMGAVSNTMPTHMAVGSGSTAVAATDTTLGTEITRAALTTTVVGTSSTEYNWFVSSTVGNGNTFREIGLFNAGAAGSMFARAVLTSTIAKTSSIAVNFTWVIGFTAN